MIIEAIHPDSDDGELLKAYLVENHFGPGKDAIRFSGINSPYFSASDIEWDFLSDEHTLKM